MKPEKDKKFARWLVKVLCPGYHLQRDREAGKKDRTEIIREQMLEVMRTGKVPGQKEV